jgi:putative ABC transport system substrate-binding protein
MNAGSHSRPPLQNARFCHYDVPFLTLELDMKRREFLGVLGGATAAWPLATRAQQPLMPVIGFLNSASADGYASMAAAFRQGLKETGYVEGNNVAIEYRWADDQYDRLPALARDLVNRRVSVIFANSPSTPAAKAATSTIPIIIMSGDDPVRLGFVASFNRPGGNITGVSILSQELAAKRLDLLRELVPHAKTIAILVNSDFGPTGRFQSDAEAAARALRLSIEFLQANNEPEINQAFNSLAQIRPDALLVGPGPFLDSRRDLLVALAAKIAIPAAYETRATAVAGGLMSYGADVADGYRRAGLYVGRILKGEKPAELPVDQATKFEFVINLKTAKALGLDVPPALSARADEVIE